LPPPILCAGPFSLDEFAGIVSLSLAVSTIATVIAALIGLPAGTMLAVFSFPGRRLLVIVVNALFGLPPVVVGLALYLALSHSGPLGFLGLLFTPAAMVVAQAILAAPIVTAVVHRAAERAWGRYGDALLNAGASRIKAVPHVLAIARAEVATAVLAGFGRTVSEVGAIILVGGNIRGQTRTMTTAIALRTSQGDLPLALVLGLVLIGVSIAVSAAVFFLAGSASDAGADEER
jgi:tungstate transport system permease protein